ncbi:hypothetical protein [Baaleninema simplex]|uniref:hypothetical protein n=1 Tax=Baaleninema simplex TaxID=2862350 RepID=UPI00034A5796|nr:hypothetical protein [Baaleninema simplex]
MVRRKSRSAPPRPRPSQNPRSPQPWFYLMGTSAGIATALVASHYYAEVLFEAEPEDALEAKISSEKTVSSDMLRPIASEPEIWEDVVAAEAKLWKRDFTALADRVKADVEAKLARPKPLPARAIAAVGDDKPWQQNLAERTRANIERRAQRSLQAAFDRAQQRDFAAAIAFLEQIPKGTSLREKAELKAIKYRHQWNVQSEYWLYRAKYLAYGGDFAGALAYLRQIPVETSAYREAQAKIPLYVESRNQQAEALLVQADGVARRGAYTLANQYLRMIPQEAPAYAVAKDRLIEYSQKIYATAQLDRSRRPS